MTRALDAENRAEGGPYKRHVQLSTFFPVMPGISVYCSPLKVPDSLKTMSVEFGISVNEFIVGVVFASHWLLF